MPHTNRKPGYRARKESGEKSSERNRAASTTSQPKEAIQLTDQETSIMSRPIEDTPQRSRAASIISCANDEVSDKNQTASPVSHPGEKTSNRSRTGSFTSCQTDATITQRNRNTSTNSRPTLTKISIHGAGTSASWSSSNNTNNARFERLEKMARHNGFDNSPFMPRSTIDLLKHEKEFTHDKAQEELRALKNLIASSEAAKRTGHVIGPAIGAKKMPTMGNIWEPGAEDKLKADWPCQAEYRRYGDSAANSAFKLPRYLPPPRNKFVTKAQIPVLINSGMDEAVAMSYLGKDPQGSLKRLQWDDMSVLEAYKNDEQMIIDEARNIVQGVFGMFHGRSEWDSASFAAEREEFNEKAVRAMGAWGELLDEVNGLRLEFAERI